jgi:GNAT superfamily N-acetyltransferase
MTIEILRVETLSDANRATLFDWGEDIFGADHFKLRWRPKDLHFLMIVDGELVSHVGILKHEVSVGNRVIRVAGVGGVVTVPHAQKRGYASELMRHAADFFSHWDVEGGLLFCMPRRVKLYQ